MMDGDNGSIILFIFFIVSGERDRNTLCGLQMPGHDVVRKLI